MNLESVPTLHPTLEELEDPIEYLSTPKIVRLGLRYGLLKLATPPTFQYESKIDKNAVSFNPRLQNLSELQLLNRARWFFLNQLCNFNANIGQPRELTRKKPYVMGKKINNNGTNNRYTHSKIYFYDLFITILKLHNKNIKFIKNNINSSSRHDKFKTFHDFNNLEIPDIATLTKLDSKIWDYLEQELNIDTEFLVSIFNGSLRNYFQFLYNFNEDHTLPICDPKTNPVSLLDHNICDSEEEFDDDDKTPSFPLNKKCFICHIKQDSPLLECKTCNNWFHENCFNLKYKSFKIKIPTHCHECVVGNGVYGFTMDDNDFTILQFSKLYDIQTPSDLISLENEFWEKVNNPMSQEVVKYGADIPYPESLLHYSKPKQPINLLNLPNNKRSLLRFCKKDNDLKLKREGDRENTAEEHEEISGMTLPWLYVGSQFSTFCWHMEDQYTLSANYQHEGAPKIWYSIPPQSCYEFGRALYQLTPDLFIKDQNLIHQLTCLMSPYDPVLSKVKCYKAIQYPGEFIITFPQCYHSGFNTGYNFNEAVNFTADFWIDFGKRAINDYKFTRKTCVFDIYILLESILKEYLNSTTRITNLGLYRDAFNVLLNFVNVEMKRMAKLSENGIQMCYNPDTNNKIGLANNEIICSKCHTTCTFAYCKLISSKDTVVLCLEHGIQQMNGKETMELGRLITNVTQDMDDILELLRQCGQKLDQ